jgi:hypothetical protein
VEPFTNDTKEVSLLDILFAVEWGGAHGDIEMRASFG